VVWRFRTNEPVGELRGAPPAAWTMVRSGTWRGMPLQARFDTSLREDEAAAARLPHWASITAFLQNPEDNGMPGQEESERLTRLEEAGFASLGDAEDVLLVGAVTIAGRHELMLYAASAEAAREHFRRLAKVAEGWELQLTVMEDTTWEVYRQFVP
jgi:hypothetical protein